MTKYDFCSDEYLHEAGRILARLADEYAALLGDETFSSCVVCFDAPAHARPGADGVAAWAMSVGAGVSSVTRGRRDDVDSLVQADYVNSIPRAKRVLDDASPPDEEAGVRRSGDISQLSDTMRRLLRTLHNELAALTA